MPDVGARGWRSAAIVALTVSTFFVEMSGGAAATEEVACSLRPNPHISAEHQWPSCLSVSASLATLPAVGATATLTFEVTAELARSEVRIDADLPAGLEWERPPDGMRASEVRSAVPADRGELHRASGVASFSAGQTRRFQGRVQATESGPADIAVRVFAPADDDAPVPADHVYLTVAEPGGRSTPGMAGQPESTAVPAPAEPTRAAPPMEHRPAGVGAAAPARVVTQADTACVTGGWSYVDHQSVVRSSANYQVQVWDLDEIGPNELLSVTETDTTGAYTSCFDNNDVDDWVPAGGQDVFVMFVSENARWRVQETGTGKLFTSTTEVVPDIATNTTHDFNNRVPDNPLHYRGVQAFDAISAFWIWKEGDCWDLYDPAANCTKMVVNWRWDSQVGTYYSLATKQIQLLAGDPDSRDLTVHEATYAVLHDMYEFSWPPNANGPHPIKTASTPGMAWVEGFALWTPGRVYQHSSMHFPDGTALDLEPPTWGSAGWGNGHNVAGRVAGALIDLSDNANESVWDRLAEGAPGSVWVTFSTAKSNSFSEFWAQRDLVGYDVGPNGLATLWQNTIDYGFCDPLSDDTPVSRPTPVPAHSFCYDTKEDFWSVVALRPPAGADYDLRLYDAGQQSGLRATSNLSGSTVDFIAVDSNDDNEPVGDFYPRVTQFSGSGTYGLELAQSQLTLIPGATPVTMSSDDVVAVYDANLAQGFPVTIKVTPGNATQDAELFIVQSHAGQPGTYVRSRSSAVQASTAGGPGAVESITFTPNTNDWYGVVLINKAGSGTYTLQRM